MRTAPHVLAALVPLALLLAAAGCGDTNEPRTGALRLSVVTTGGDLDLNGYVATVDGAEPRALPTNGSAVIGDIPTGSHDVALTDVAANCTLSGQNPRAVNVAGGDTTDVALAIGCVAVTGVIEVTTATSGVDLDANGYQVSLDGGTPQAVGVNGVVRFSGVSGGDHLVSLGDAAPNCLVSGENPRTLPVAVGGVTRDTARTTFAVACEPATGTARIITATTGADPDPDGYRMVVDCYDYYGYACYYYYHAEQMSPNDTVVLAGVPSGSHTFQIDGVAQNCTVTGENPRTVHVTGGATTEVTFTVTCAATGSMQVTTATTGVDPDPNGYGVVLDGAIMDTSAVVGANASVSISNLVAGDYSVTLFGVAANCDLVGPNPRTVSVPSGGTAAVAFDVTCAQAAQLALALTVAGNTDVYEIKANGTGLNQLTTHAGYDADPAWSPNGTKIAFFSERDGDREVYVMNADGSSQVRLTTALGQDYHPTWSADGSRIAFLSARDGNFEIYVMNADGTGQTRLTTNTAVDADPAWSPDGSKIAFWSTRDGNGEIYVMNPDGSGVTRLTNNGVEDVQPEWSPDGAKLVFSRLTGCDSYTGFCDYDLIVMNADGSGAAQLTSGSSDNEAAWSPDGRWIAFGASFCQDYYYGCYYSYSAVHLVRTDGSRVTELLGDAFHPAWRP